MKTKINNKEQAIEVQDFLIKIGDPERELEIIETGEILTIADILYNADWNDFESLTLIG